MNYVLTRTDYGSAMGQYGLPKLISRKTLLSAYPLHDGDWKWTDKGPLNNRQVSYKKKLIIYRIT